MRNDRVAEIRKIDKQNQKIRKITWEKFCRWFDKLDELAKLNFRAAIRSEKPNYQLLSEEKHSREKDMIQFARGVLEKLGVLLS